MKLTLCTFSVLSHLRRKRLTGQVVIQMTDRCNASCPQCGMRITEKFPRSKLSTDRLKRILDGAARMGVQAVSFTGGEPFLFFDELTALITHAGNAGIRYLRTGTNGFFLLHSEGPRFRSRIRIFSPLSSLLSLHRQYAEESEKPYPCRGGIDFFYPCGYRGNENLGKPWDVNPGVAGSTASCVLCDWECFRDPSELAGPLLQGVSHPGKLVRRVLRDTAYFRVWAQDLRYLRAFDFFDGRRPPRFERLLRFRPGPLFPFRPAAFHPP